MNLLRRKFPAKIACPVKRTGKKFLNWNNSASELCISYDLPTWWEANDHQTWLSLNLYISYFCFVASSNFISASSFFSCETEVCLKNIIIIKEKENGSALAWTLIRGIRDTIKFVLLLHHLIVETIFQGHSSVAMKINWIEI